ncbi:Nuclease-related domain protein [Poriferisphaera corsica]|uniref:DNA 3'-5' helicase II n=1 Tax=Poriferisphaera corsica TaxID=2528020 RepID=A0A517YS27_9BACT|nr:NERD domain-containing protein [Poriferisphaera corsica]QDU33022.1 Nuclease-related domain protein [Poriferisphaera corsica]
MAYMVPREVKSETVSRAERMLFTRFRRELPDNYIVLHSLGLKNHSTKIWGECDFVVISPYAILVLEVKGGRINFVNGEWIFTNRNGTNFVKSEGPFEQAKSAMFAVREIVNQHCSSQAIVGYGVMMPDDKFISDCIEIEQQVLWDIRNKQSSLDVYLKQIIDYWRHQYQKKYNANPVNLTAKQIDEIRRALRPDIRSARTLDSMLCQVESEQVELTEEQIDVLTRIDNNSRTLVSGSAGTGKTILAMDKAIRLAESGKKTLYVCYNKLLGDHLNNTAKDIDNLTAISLHSWFMSVVKNSNLGHHLVNCGDEKYFSEQLPRLYMDALTQLDESYIFDCLIIDEAQDLLTESYFDALDLTLRKGINSGECHIFMDPLQNIYSQSNDDILEELNDTGFVKYELSVNCRNTKQIAVAASIVSGLDVSTNKAVEGQNCDVEFVDDLDWQDKIEKIISKYIKNHIEVKDIIILGPRKLEKSSLANMDRIYKIKIRNLNQKSELQSKKYIDYSTIHSYKGLERRAVVVIDIQDLNDSYFQLLHYCGLTRARSMMTVLVNKREKEVYDEFARQYGIRQSSKIN